MDILTLSSEEILNYKTMVNSSIEEYKEKTKDVNDDGILDSGIELPICGKGSSPINYGNTEVFNKRLFCPIEQCYINPMGFTCTLCNVGQWPEKTKLYNTMALMFRETQLKNNEEKLTFIKNRIENILVDAVQKGVYTEDEAITIVEKFGL